MDSVFNKLAINREEVKWENYLATLTPWQNKAGVWFKREDYFAPLGYSGPNGSKMRQLIWYVNRFKGMMVFETFNKHSNGNTVFHLWRN